MAVRAWDQNEETRLANYLVRTVCERAAGRPDTECLHNYPHDTYFVGNLRPREDALVENGSEPEYLQELLTKLAPVAFGAEFRLRVPNGSGVRIELHVTVAWASYYRVFPTFEQQRGHQQRLESGIQAGEDAKLEPHNGPDPLDPLAKAVAEVNSITDADSVQQEAADVDAVSLDTTPPSPEVFETAGDRRRNRSSKDSLFLRFRKIQCRTQGTVFLGRNADGHWTVDIDALRQALDREAKRAQGLAMADPERVRTAASPIDRVHVPDTAIASEADFAGFLRTLQTDVVPDWHWQTAAEVNDHQGDSRRVTLWLQLVNASPSQMPRESRREHPHIEPFLFDVQASFAFPPGVAQPFELELAARGFRYDRQLWGRGFNCAVERDPSNPDTFNTTHTPVYPQPRYVTREEPRVAFQDLASDPVPVLERVLSAMRQYLSEWDRQRAEYVAADPGWEIQFGREFDRDLRTFEDEIARFQRGLDLVRTDNDVHTAFRLTNETFRRGPNEHWRLFQLVFLVGQIPGIAALAHPTIEDVAEREVVDIIYFPTGGGKTEAYLATIVFHCFFDRLRGKTAGVTTWTRFPMRLLTLQQTQRYADVIGAAELVRRDLEQVDPRLKGPGVTGFAVGYFVGEGGSPNQIFNPAKARHDADDEVTWSKANDVRARQDWKRVARCPGCGSDVRVDFDIERSRLIHRCVNPACPFPEGVIPVYIVDNEIFRYLPAVIVGTIDKLAAIGNQRKLAQVFGQVDGYCAVHGYYKGKCSQKDCDDKKKLRPKVPRGLSGPTLFVQDELHLLKEGLGTFDGHYETFTQQLRRQYGQVDPLKIIASSATIEAFERQARHLYGGPPRRARAFPGPGPSFYGSFYAQTMPYPQRLYVGLIPHNKTIFNTILELIEAYHREVQTLLRLPNGQPNPYGGNLTPGTSSWSALLDNYATSLTYFLANRELSAIRTDLEGDVNPNLLRDGLDQLTIYQLTGDTGTDEVSRTLEILERKGMARNLSDAVLATNMVSHGVDVERLNAMIFYGMPRQTAEYIQASSRVGRSHVGIVFDCLHPARERDQSHYGYFVKYHQFLGQLVEPVAINRWSTFSVNRTLPGLFMGVLLQLMANRTGVRSPGSYYMLDFVRKEITAGRLTIDHFIPVLEAAYQVAAPVNRGEETFQAEIRLRVSQFLDQIIGAGASATFVSEVLIPQPMTSLRDVDMALEIELDNAGTAWAAVAARR